MKTLTRIFAALVAFCGLTAFGDTATDADYINEVISLNFGADYCSVNDGDGLISVPAKAWTAASSATGSLTGVSEWNGVTTDETTLGVSWSSGASYGSYGSTVPYGYRWGYLDDGNATVTLTSIPYDKYDVYIYKSADGDGASSCITVACNDGDAVSYTAGVDGIAKEGTDNWGLARAKDAIPGLDVIIVKGLTEKTKVVINGGERTTGTKRGAIAAIQIVKDATDRKFSYTPSGSDLATATGWWTSWGGEPFVATKPMPILNRTIPYVADGAHPWTSKSAMSNYSLSIYADTEAVVVDSGKKAVMAEFGNNGYGYHAIVVNDDGTIGLLSSTGSGEVATTAKNIKGLHLYTMTFDETASELKLYMDDALVGTKTGVSKAAAGFQIGSVYQGRVDSQLKALNMGVAAIYGYETTLTAQDVKLLATAAPAYDSIPLMTDYAPADSTKTIIVPSMTSDGNHYLGITTGTMNIPAGVTVSVPHMRTVNNASSGESTLNIAGTVNVTSESSNPNVWAERSSYKGIMFGHYGGTGTANITGSLIGEKAYFQVAYTATQIVNIDGGLVKVKGLHRYTGSATVNITNNGTLEVAEADQGAVITKNFGKGTYKVDGDVTENNAITFTATGDDYTSIDANGHTLTLGSGVLKGSGNVKLLSTGNVVLTDVTDAFTGKLILADADKVTLGDSTVSGGIEMEAGTLTLDAGSEGTVTVTGGELRLVATEAQQAAGYTAKNVATSGTGTVAFYSYDGETYTKLSDGTTLEGKGNTWTNKDGTGSFGAIANWSAGKVPGEGETGTITISDDTTITMDYATEMDTLVIQGTGTATLTGEKLVTVGTFEARTDVAATAANLSMGTVTITDEATVSYDATTWREITGIVGGTFVKTGDATLTVYNGSNGYALKDTTIQVNGGKLLTYDAYSDVYMSKTTIEIGADGVFDVNGWVTVNDALTIVNETDKTILANNGNTNPATLRGTGKFTKQGAGKLTLAGPLSVTGGVDAQAGTLRLESDATVDAAVLMSNTGATYEFKNGTISNQGNCNQKIHVTAGDTVTMAGGSSPARTGCSLDVDGGTVYLGSATSDAFWFEVGSSKFNLKGGEVISRQTSTTQSGSSAGLLIGWSGAPSEFNISGGLLDVSNTSINFWSSRTTMNITGGEVKAGGIFAGQTAGNITIGAAGKMTVGDIGIKSGAVNTFTVDGTLNLGANSRNLTLAGSGTVNVKLTADEAAGSDAITVFTATEGATVALGTVTDAEGTEIVCRKVGGVVTPVHYYTVTFEMGLVVKTYTNPVTEMAYDAEYQIEADTDLKVTVTVTGDYQQETVQLYADSAALTKDDDGVFTLEGVSGNVTITATATKAPTGPTVPTSEGTIEIKDGNAVITPKDGATSITVSGTVNGNVTIPSTVTTITVTKTGDLIVTGKDSNKTDITKYLKITNDGTTYTIGDVNKEAVEEDGGLEPTEVDTTEGVTVKAIAGLTYQLIGSITAPNGTMSEASDAVVGEGEAITLEDTKLNPTTKAFYKVQVTK